MAQAPELIIKIIGDDKQFKKSLNDLPNASNKAALSMNAAATAGAAGVTALAVGLAAAVKASAEFEETFSNVITLLDKSSFATSDLETGINDLRKGVLKLRAETGESFENLNRGLFDLISAGVDAEKAIDALNVATNLAIAGATDTSTAVDGITSALNAYELSAADAQDVAEKFFTAQKFGKTTVEELSNGFGLVASSANSFGVSLDELLASVAAATTGGIQTSQAYTGLAAILANISKPTKDAADEADRLGIVFNSSALRAQGLDGFLKSITESSGFTDTSLEKLFGSVEAVKTVLAITGAGADDFANILETLGDKSLTTATFQAALAEKNDTLAQSTKRLQGSIDSLTVQIGNEFAPVVKNAFDELSDGINENTPKIIRFIRDISAGMFTVASIIGDFFGTVFKRVIGDIQRFSAQALLTVSNIVKGIQNLAAKAGIDLNFEGSTRALEQQALKFAEAANKNLEGATGGDFVNQLKTRLDNLKTFNDEEERLRDEARAREKEKEYQHQQELIEQAENQRNEKNEKEVEGVNSLNEVLDEIAAQRAEREEEKRQEQLEKEDEQFEEDLERLTERLSGFDEVEAEFAGVRELRELKELKDKARNAQQKEKVDKAAAAAAIKYGDLSTQNALDNLQTVFSEETAVGKAIFLLRKAQAIADTIVNTQAAMALARATVPPPAGEALALRYAIAGAINVGVIASTAITGAAEGGIVQGGVIGRDTEPFMLAKDEIVVPSRLNPLSPNFDETFGGGFGGAQSVTVDIALDEQASKVLTVKQREDSVLGIQK